MDKLNFVHGGATKLPPGFRFQPTDEEIVYQYLTHKIFSHPLPASVVPEINLCNYDPWDLPECERPYVKCSESCAGDLEQDKYFFTQKEAKYQVGNRANRATGSGYWKATGSDKRISCPKRKDHLVGMRKTLVFHTGKPANGSRTDWIMHEYRLVKSETQNNMVQIGNWVLCHMFLKRRRTENEDEILQVAGKEVRVNKNDTGPSSSSTSSSGSSVTKAAKSSWINQEENSQRRLQ